MQKRLRLDLHIGMAYLTVTPHSGVCPGRHALCVICAQSAANIIHQTHAAGAPVQCSEHGCFHTWICLLGWRVNTKGRLGGARRPERDRSQGRQGPTRNQRGVRRAESVAVVDALGEPTP